MKNKKILQRSVLDKYYKRLVTASVIVAFFFVMTLFSVSCSKHENTEPKHPCDTIELTYSGVIQPLLEQNCYGCHGNGNSSGDQTLDTYEDVYAAAMDGRLYGVVNHVDGYPAMPYYRPQLDSCSLYFINRWIEEGAPNN